MVQEAHGLLSRNTFFCMNCKTPYSSPLGRRLTPLFPIGFSEKVYGFDESNDANADVCSLLRDGAPQVRNVDVLEWSLLDFFFNLIASPQMGCGHGTLTNRRPHPICADAIKLKIDGFEVANIDIL